MAKDLKDQPDSKFILLTGAGRPVYYAVDNFYFKGTAIVFELNNEIVYVCREEGTWALVARTAVNVVTDADMARHQMAEGKQVEAFYEQLDPEGWKEAQKMAAAGGLEAILSGGGAQRPHQHADDGKPVPGQYL